MATPDTSETVRRARKAAVEDALRRGFEPPSPGLRSNGAVNEAARTLNMPKQTLHSWIEVEERRKKCGKKHLLPDWGKFTARPVYAPPEPIYLPPAAYTADEDALVLISDKDNTFTFGAAGDLHGGSKYTRWDVRHDLYRQFIEAGATCNFDTGNWIDGEAPFNRYDIEAHGLESQCRLLAREHPIGLKTYAVWGDDHEGWYVQREGIDVGRYAASVMTDAGHDWENLGFMEAHVILRNANSGEEASMAVVHPGGGSAYATSYSIQKIIESYEGGEKPAVGLYGHYHKLWSGLIRNVWTAQTGCQQDQTPFMRKKRLEAHVGGTLIKLKQDPRTGAILSFQCELIRYFNKGWYAGSGRWSKHAKPKMLPRVKHGV